MKAKFLLLSTLVVASLYCVAQTLPASPYPCLRTLATKNLGNNPNCQSTYQGYEKSGIVVVSFSSAIPAGVTAPQIVSLLMWMLTVTPPRQSASNFCSSHLATIP